jgi:hypothetical protein
MHTFSPNKPKKFIQTKSACRKDYGSYFQGRSADSGIRATRIVITSEVYCETLQELRRAIHNKRCGMLTYGVALLHHSACPHTAARTRTLLENFNWELFDHSPYNPDLAPTYLLT